MDNYTNILFLLPDQHRRDWTGFNRELDVATPNLKRLAKRGVRFTRAYTPSPLCAPARACLASGLGYRECRVPSNGENYPLEQPTYYTRLRDAGYRVGGVGKFDLHKATLDWNLDGSRLIDRWGFTDGIDNEGKLDGSISYNRNGGPKGPYLQFLEERSFAKSYVEEHATRNEQQDAYTTVLTDEAYCDNWLANNGLEVLEGIPVGTPWHLVVNFTGPHSPMDVTKSMRGSVEGRSYPAPFGVDSVASAANKGYSAEDHQRNRQNYSAMVENIDRQVGRFIDAVEARGELDKTLIVYSSDHGEMLGDHSRWGKSTWQEPSVGVPFIIAPPESMNLPVGRTTNAIVSLHDLAATFTEIAGAQPLPLLENETSSRSLLPILRGERDSHRSCGTSALDAGQNRPVDSGWRMVANERYKLVETGYMNGKISETSGYMLFNLVDDPCEEHDISTKEPETVELLKPSLP